MTRALLLVACMALAATASETPDLGVCAAEGVQWSDGYKVDTIIYSEYRSGHYQVDVCFNKALYTYLMQFYLYDNNDRSKHYSKGVYNGNKCFKFYDVKLPSDGHDGNYALILACYGHTIKTLDTVKFQFHLEQKTSYFECNHQWWARAVYDDSHKPGPNEKCLSDGSKACYRIIYNDTLDSIQEGNNYPCYTTPNLWRREGNIQVCQPSRWERLNGAYLRWSTLDYDGYLYFNYTHKAPAVTEAVMTHKGDFSVSSMTDALEVAILDFRPSTDLYGVCAVQVDPHRGPVAVDSSLLVDVDVQITACVGDYCNIKLTNMLGWRGVYYSVAPGRADRHDCILVPYGDECYDAVKRYTCDSFLLSYAMGNMFVVARDITSQ